MPILVTPPAAASGPAPRLPLLYVQVIAAIVLGVLPGRHRHVGAAHGRVLRGALMRILVAGRWRSCWPAAHGPVEQHAPSPTERMIAAPACLQRSDELTELF